MPYTWTEEKKQQAIKDVLEHIESGKSLRSILDKADREILPTCSTWFEWVEESEALAKQYARAMEVRQEKIFEECLEIADKQGMDLIETENGAIVNHNVIARNRLQIETRQWMLGKMNAPKYGNKVDVTSGGKPISAPILQNDPLTDAGDNGTP
jgi:hypothetical protein